MNVREELIGWPRMEKRGKRSARNYLYAPTISEIQATSDPAEIFIAGKKKSKKEPTSYFRFSAAIATDLLKINRLIHVASYLVVRTALLPELTFAFA